jgi:general secretion pathway protein G
VAGNLEQRHKTCRSDGFTLIEMMIVISLILILVSIAVPIYNRSILRAKESVLRQDLFTLRQVISQYTMDKQRAPQSLDDLVQAHYLKHIPVDPLSNQNDWLVEVEEDPIQQEQGISDVRSGFNGASTDGTAYLSW